MARKARAKSSVGYYYIRLKAADEIEFNHEDGMIFLRCLKHYSGFELLCYLLTSKNFSFVIHEGDLHLEQMMRKVLGKFIRAYKKEHSAIQEIFKDRYYSEPADNIEQVFSFIGKIHNLGDSFHSLLCSMPDYLENPYVDRTFYHRYCQGIDDFQARCQAYIMKNKNHRRLSDEELKTLLEKTYQISIMEIYKLPKSKLIRILDEVMRVTKVSARQIARITTLPLRFLWDLGKRITSTNNAKIEKEGTYEH